jgi:hypothetical protein
MRLHSDHTTNKGLIAEGDLCGLRFAYSSAVLRRVALVTDASYAPSDSIIRASFEMDAPYPPES